MIDPTTNDGKVFVDRAELLQWAALLRRYRKETPLGHQPHMIAGEAEAAYERIEKIANANLTGGLAAKEVNDEQQ